MTYRSYSRESGAYPPGAEFDPRAPWNEKEIPEIECTNCGGTGKVSFCCEAFLDNGKCIECDEYPATYPCPHCKGEGYREMTADEMQEEADNEFAAKEEQAERHYEMLREERR